MEDEKFEKKKKEIFKKIKSSGKLDEELEEDIINLYESRGENAIEVIKNDRIRNENDRWFVKGSEEEYEIVGSQCSCYDFVLNVVTEKTQADMCYHALAKRIKELLESRKYEE